MASRSLGVLTIDLVARVGGFTAGMTAAERAADKSLSAIEKRAYDFGQTLGKGLKAAGLAAIAGIGAFAVALKSSIDSIDELNRSAQQIGVTTEELSKLAYAGELADISLDTLTGALGKLTKAQAEALDSTSKQAKLFDALGISVKKADGTLKSSTEVLGDFAEVFKALNGSPEAIAAGFQIFGRSFQELIPLLLDGRKGIEDAGAELEKFGGVITTEAGKNADEFNDTLTKLKVQFASIFSQVASQLLPTLVDLVSEFSNVAKDGKLAANAVTLINAAVSVGVGVINFYNGAVDRLAIAFELANKAGEGYLETQKNILSLGLADGSVAGGIRKIGAAADDAQARLDALGKAQEKLADFSGVRASSSSTAKTPEEAQAAAAEARLKKLLALFNQSSTAKDKDTKATKELTEAEKAWQDVMEVNQLIDEESRKAQEDIRRDRQDRADDFANLISDIQTQNDLLGKTAEQQDLINTARQYGIDLASEEGKILSDTLAQYHANQAAIQDTITVMDGLRDASKGFLQDLKDGVGVVDAIKNAFDSLIQTIFDAVAQNLIEQLLGQSGTATGGASGNLFTDILGAFFGGARANGGPVNSGGVYRVNERGPELLTVGNRDYLMMGNSSGTVSPTAGGGVTINNSYINPNLNDWRSESQRRSAEAAQLRLATARNGS